MVGFSEWFWNTPTVDIIIRLFELMGRKLPENEHDRKGGKVSTRFILLLWINVAGMTNSILLAYRYWDLVDYKVDFVLNVVVIYFQFCAIIHLIFYPYHYIIIFKVLESNLYTPDKKYPLTEEQLQLLKETNRRQKTVHILFSLSVLAWTAKSLFGTAGGIKALYTKNFESIEDFEILMVYITIPVQKIFENRYFAILVFSLISLIQALIFLCTLEMSGNFCYLVTCIIKKLEAEIKILRLSIEGIDERILPDREKAAETYPEKYELELKHYFDCCVKHHQIIIRSIKNVNDAISFMMFPFNNVIAVIVGLKLYFLLEGTGSLYNITDIISAFFALSLICYMGQGLIDESVLLYGDLTMCTWLDKPRWFARDLRISMCCAQRPLTLQTALYTINLSNVIMVLQAAYSYVNLMWNLKSNRN